MDLPPRAFRRRLRHEATAAERRLWAILRGRGLTAKFRRQHTVGPYALDFYCPEARLCVEADGSQHHLAGELDRDALREAFLRVSGISILRFTNHQILAETASVREAIWRALDRAR